MFCTYIRTQQSAFTSPKNNWNFVNILAKLMTYGTHQWHKGPINDVGIATNLSIDLLWIYAGWLFISIIYDIISFPLGTIFTKFNNCVFWPLTIVYGQNAPIYRVFQKSVPEPSSFGCCVIFWRSIYPKGAAKAARQ